MHNIGKHTYTSKSRRTKNDFYYCHIRT